MPSSEIPQWITNVVGKIESQCTMNTDQRNAVIGIIARHAPESDAELSRLRADAELERVHTQAIARLLNIPLSQGFSAQQVVQEIQTLRDKLAAARAIVVGILANYPMHSRDDHIAENCGVCQLHKLLTSTPSQSGAGK